MSNSKRFSSSLNSIPNGIPALLAPKARCDVIKRVLLIHLPPYLLVLQKFSRHIIQVGNVVVLQ